MYNTSLDQHKSSLSRVKYNLVDHFDGCCTYITVRREEFKVTSQGSQNFDLYQNKAFGLSTVYHFIPSIYTRKHIQDFVILEHTCNNIQYTGPLYQADISNV